MGTCGVAVTRLVWLRGARSLFFMLPFLSGARSDVQSDDLSGWNLQLLVDTSLQVLVEKRLQLFVLLVEEASLLDQVLSVDEELVVLAQGLVEGLPHAQLLVS